MISSPRAWPWHRHPRTRSQGGAQTNERWQSVAHSDAVGPEPGCAAAPVGKRVNALPPRMDPCTKIQDGRELIGIRFLSGGHHRVQFPDERVEHRLKIQQLLSNFGRIHTELGANSHLSFFEA